MENMRKKQQVISDVLPGSPAERAGLSKGDVLLSIDGEPVIDLVDYEHLTASDRLTLKIIKENGSCEQIDLEKEDYEPLGLSFATSLMDNMRTCKNHCVFCFIDQMPKGGRSSLHVKDDDWRMSFVMGNYVTLTNLDERELDRVIRRRVSPLYISLHASDPEVRRAMMKNPHAGDILPQLKRLADAGLQFHLQIVLCPGLNDGDVLRRSIDDMLLLYPRARSLAVVPVGLTRHRDKLYPLRTFTREEAEATIDEIEARQAELLREHGTRFVFLADEWYTLCGRSLPAYDAYEGFPQIENGVGLLRLFEGDMLEALEEKKPLKRAKRFLVAGGTSAQAFFAESYRQLLPYHITLDVRAIRNRFFGESVTVGGLITGGDLVVQLMGEDFGRALLIPRAMLKADEELFLDGMRKSEAEKKLGTRIIPVASGDHLVEIIFSE
ncbi:MAG TPA: radical SAM protein [Clostridiales bacterium]|nr:radical SAM protein [Clostridiales bacterium]